MKISKRSFFLGILLTLLSPAAMATTLVQEFFVPLPDDQIQKAMKVLYSSTGTQMNAVISIVCTTDGTVIHYDHWEDGYEPDLENPVQGTTQILTCDRGGVKSSRNTVDLPRNPGIIKYDGRDRFGASIAVAATRAGWAAKPGTILAGAAEMLATRDYGNDFKMPVGQNLGAIDNSMFVYVGMIMVAGENGTSCTYNGTPLPILNKGSNYQRTVGCWLGIICTAPVARRRYIC